MHHLLSRCFPQYVKLENRYSEGERERGRGRDRKRERERVKEREREKQRERQRERDRERETERERNRERQRERQTETERLQERGEKKFEAKICRSLKKTQAEKKVKIRGKSSMRLIFFASLNKKSEIVLIHCSGCYSYKCLWIKFNQ